MLDDRPKRLQTFWLAMLVEGGLAVLSLALGRLIGQPALGQFRWDARDAALGAAASVPLLVAFVLFQRWPLGPLARIKQFLDEFARPMFQESTLLELLLISTAAGWGEEMLFRAVLQGAFCRWSGPWIGVATASLLFGLAHPITPLYTVWAGLIGVYLGWLAMASGNLLVVIVTHGLYDFVAICYLVRRR